MNQITVIKKNGTTFNLFDKAIPRTVESATQNVELLGRDTVTMTVKSGEPITFDIGDKINIIGRVYTLNTPPLERKAGDRLYYYDLVFEGMQYELMRATFSVNVDTTTNEIQDISGDSLTGDVEMFLNVLVSNANRVFGADAWIVGDFPANTETKTITFNEGDNCLSVLQRLCSEDNFSTEFSISINETGQRVLNIGPAGNVFPYTFEYGKGNGLYELVRERLDSTNLITRLHAYGSTKNIVTNKYKMPDESFRGLRLCLAGKKKGTSYIDDATAIAKYGLWESTKIFDDIYPTRKGTVTGLGSTALSFVDSTMDFDLNEKELDGKTTKYLIVGVNAKIHFNTGNLAGYEFELERYNHSTKTFSIIQQQDENGYTFPSETSAAFQIGIGDEYVITDIFCPESYIIAAETKLALEAQKHLDTYKKPQVKYSLSIDPMFLRGLVGDETSTNVFGAGDYIDVVDTPMDIDVSLRIKSFSRDLIKEFNYTLTIADRPVTVSTLTEIVNSTINNTTVITNNKLNDPARARRNWLAAQEVLNKIFDPEGFYYTDSIRPLSIDTTMLSVGSKSMQFSLEGIVFQPNYREGTNPANPNRVISSEGALVHFAILDENNQPRVWTISANDTTLNSGDERYVYARCDASGGGGTIKYETEKIVVDSEPGYYNFLIGVLSSVIDGARIMSLMYGFTTINGRFIKTGRIQNGDGTTYFDLDAGEFRGNFKFTSGESIQDYVSGIFAGVKVGGTNLFRNSASPLFNPNLPGTGTSVKITNEDEPFYRATPDAGKAVSLFGGASALTYVAGRDYVSSIYVRQASGSPVTFTYYNEGNHAVSSQNTVVQSGVWTRISTKPYQTAGAKNMILIAGTANVVVDYKKVKVENGTIPTDWSASPEDYDQQFIDIKSYADTVASGLQSQIDGVVDSWFFPYSPTASNEPAVSWNTPELKQSHVGDTFTNTQEYVDDITTPDAGKSWRWVEVGGVYSWTQIADSDAVKALIEAGLAKDVADNKRRVFVSQPQTSQAYDVGDLWVNANYSPYSNDFLRCKTAKAAGVPFDIAHWELASKYTDDGALNNFVNNVYTGAIGDINTQLDRKIESWFQEADPATGWSSLEKENHVGDMWYKSSEKALRRYVVNAGVYSWELIEDQKAIDAFTAASDAQDTADGKRRVFVSQPQTADAYDVGDLWVNATYGIYSNDLLRCSMAKSSGTAFNILHWEKATKYTDDTEAILAAAMAKYGGGKMLYRDPSFSAGMNSTALYNNNGGTAVTLQRIARQSDNPSTSTHQLKITYVGGSSGASPGIGGFRFETPMSRAGGIYMIRLIAKIPVGYDLETTYNAIGTGGTHTWLTARAGKGSWEEYIVLIRCGVSGSFSNFGYIYLEGAATPNTEWHVAYATVYDAISPEMTATEYLREALQGSTDVLGGLLATNVLLMKNSVNEVTGGMSGLSTDNIGMWTGGTYQQAIGAIAKVIFRKDGSGQLAGGKILWDLAGALSVGNFKIEGGGIIGYDDNKQKIKLHTGDVDSLSSLAGLVTNDPTPYSVDGEDTLTNTTGAPYDYEFLRSCFGSLTVPANTTITLNYPTVSLSVGQGGTITSTNKFYRIKLGSTLIGEYTGSSVVLTAGGTYTIEYVADYHVMIAKSATCGMILSTSVAGYISYQIGVERSEIGKNGLFSYWGASLYMYFSALEGLNVKGATDLPGVLASGSISSAGSVTRNWGAKYVSGSRTTTGTYRINHSIGHTNYAVQLTSQVSERLAYVGNKYNDYVIICATNTSGTLTDTGLEFLITGSN